MRHHVGVFESDLDRSAGAHGEFLEVEEHLVGDGPQCDDRGTQVHEFFAQVDAALAAGPVDHPVGYAQSQVVDAAVAR